MKRLSGYAFAVAASKIGAEQWRDIPGWPYHKVSNLGRVKVVRHVIHRRDGTTQIVRDNIRKHTIKHGYPSIVLCYDNALKNFKIHDLVLLAFVGPKPPGKQVRHLDDVKTNSCLYNLKYGSSLENGRDKVLNGRSAKGSRHGVSVLDEDAVRDIKMALLEGTPGAQLARDYGVSKATISKIKTGAAWSHV